jgi:hypothetical protein
MGCQRTPCSECGALVKKCNMVDGKCKYCAGKKK